MSALGSSVTSMRSSTFSGGASATATCHTTGAAEGTIKDDPMLLKYLAP
jgi:hypothetical protein